MNERDFDTKPYTPDERRVCEYLQQIVPDIGCGDDPVGFIIASHAFPISSRWIKIENAPLETEGFIWTPEETWDNRTDQTGTVYEYTDKNGKTCRLVSSAAKGWAFTHWHPLLDPPKVVS
jgi:Protein of unknown function (DUF551)